MKVTLKERDGSLAPDFTKTERGGSLAGEYDAGHGAHGSPSGSTQWTSQYMSLYAQGCDDFDQQVGTKTFGVQALRRKERF